MANEGLAAALQALGVIAETAASVHKNTLIVEENVLDRRAKEREAEKSREHQLELQESAHENRLVEQKVAWVDQMILDYPGLETELDSTLGIQVPTKNAFQTYDWSQSKAVKEGLVTNTIENLNIHGIHIDSTDDDDIINKKWLSYNLGKNYSQNLFSSTLSSDISFLMGGDVSAHQYTQEDVVDFEGFIEANTNMKGEIGPLAVNELQKMGILPDAVDIKYDANNVPYIDAQDQIFVKTVIQGIKAGTTINKNFMNTEKYHEWLKLNRQENIGFAATIAGSPHANQMVEQLNKVAASMQQTLGFTQDPTGTTVIFTWGGQQQEFGKVIESIEDSGLSDVRIQRLKNVVTNLKGVSTASGVETLAIYLDTLKPAELTLLKGDLAALGGTAISNSIAVALDRYRRVNKVVDLTTAYMQDPITVDKAIGMRKDMESLGIYSGLQEIRALEAAGYNEDDPTFKGKQDAIVGRIGQISASYYTKVKEAEAAYNAAKGADKIALKTKFDDAQRAYTELNEWLELESSVSALSLSSITQ